MFLNAIEKVRVRIPLLPLGLVLVAGIMQAAELELPCSLELPVFDSSGGILPFKIVAVSPEGDPKMNLLADSLKGTEYSVSLSGDTLRLSRKWLGGRRLEVTFVSEKGTRISKRLALMSCKQRTSLRYGQKDTGLDVSVTTVTGRLIGCTLAGNWWIRAMPMFGGYDDPASYEGYVAADGAFELTSSLRGERTIFVVGRDKQPVKAFGVDVIAGGKNNAGAVDLSGSCPK